MPTSTIFNRRLFQMEGMEMDEKLDGCGGEHAADPPIAQEHLPHVFVASARVLDRIGGEQETSLLQTSAFWFT